jgi:histidyl-tRNA synthetase
LELFPKNIVSSVEVLFVNFGQKESSFCLKLLKELRACGISAEIYPSNVKMKKQMQYANLKNIKYVVLVGEQEIKEELYSVKNMQDGLQKRLNFKDLLLMIKNN